MTVLPANLAKLEHLDLAELRVEWQQRYGKAVPPSMSRKLLRLAVGYKMQEKVFGGLSRRTLLQLSALKSTSGARGRSDIKGAAPAPKSGTKLIREWRGKVHEVLALEDGQFAYGGKTYRSLTTVVRQITGTHQSGPRFFGLKFNAGSETVGITADG